jgi:hypothetical protein
MMLATCATCGQPVASTAMFCAVCGQPVRRACAQCGGLISAQAQFCGTGMTVYIEPTVASGHAGETDYSTWCLELGPTGYQKSGTAKSSCKIPAGPLASDPWNGQIALEFNMDAGYTEWIYKWVPAGS